VTTKDALLLIHGLASNRTRWSEFVGHTRLGADWLVLNPDLRGHGQGARPQRATLDDWCADLVALLDGHGARGAVVVGHSLGAQVALHLAGSAPARVLGLVLIDPVFRSALHPSWARVARLGPLFDAAARAVHALNRIGLHRRGLVPDDLERLDAMAREALVTPEREAEFVRRYSSTRADLHQMHTAQYLQDVVEMFRGTPPLAAIRVPVLTLLSTGATFADPQRMRAALEELPDGEVATIECHHWPLTERPAEVRARIEDWVARRFPRR
jgi:pimeloyl-ACP methyl ester carboxylesterase